MEIEAEFSFLFISKICWLAVMVYTVVYTNDTKISKLNNYKNKTKLLFMANYQQFIWEIVFITKHENSPN